VVVITDLIRERCAWVAGEARHVQLIPESIPTYAAALPLEQLASQPGSFARPLAGEERDHAAAYWLTLDAINFGSGWFPTLRKRPGMSGYRTIEAGLRDRFDRFGPWSTSELQALSAAQLAQVFGQDPDHPLMALFAASLHDLGGHLERTYGGSFAAVVDAADGSAVVLVETLAGWGCFADTSVYRRREVPFLKRAQIAAADLHRAGAASFDDVGKLTMFADNLVPHVLRLDGVLWFEPELVARIDRGELIEHGSEEEVEIRACALHAVELLVRAIRDREPAVPVSPAGSGSESAPVGTPPVTATAIDDYLWNRGQSPAYKSHPRHRSRCTAY